MHPALFVIAHSAVAGLAVLLPVAVLALLVCWSIPLYNSIVLARNRTREAWSGIDVQMKRVEERIQRPAAFGGAATLATLEVAVKEGKTYAREHEAMETVDSPAGVAPRDELDSVNRGNPVGRVFRVIASEPVLLYDNDCPSAAPMVLARIQPGALIVAFDDPGQMRQVNTADETSGYVDRNVKLMPIDTAIPAEVYDPKARAALEAKLPPLDLIAVRAGSPAARSNTLTRRQLWIAAAVFVGVVLGTLAVLKLAS